MPTPIAVQLYSVRDALAADPAPVIKQLADIGYAGAELHSLDDADRLAPLCRAHGFEITSAHMVLPLEDNMRRVFDAAAKHGIKRLLVPWMEPEHFTSADDIRRVCERVNRVDEQARGHGFQIGYHHHWFEMWQVEGRVAYEIMLEHLSPDVFFELDTYWVKTGGQDPVEVVAQLGKRAPLLHVKDGPATTPEANMTAAGEGVVDIPSTLRASQADWFIVELDRCDGDMMTALQKSYDYITGQGLAHGR
jgi:sugar phosphate isomerase/epimerase